MRFKKVKAIIISLSHHINTRPERTRVRELASTKIFDLARRPRIFVSIWNRFSYTTQLVTTLIPAKPQLLGWIIRKVNKSSFMESQRPNTMIMKFEEGAPRSGGSVSSKR